MNPVMKKLVAAAVVGSGLVTVPLAAATPAAADGWGHGHYGGHGWGYGHGPRYGWGGGHYGWGGHRHGGWGAPVAAGLLGGLAIGAAIGASQPHYGYGYGQGYGYASGYCHWASQPVVDDWGEVVAYRRVRICD